MSLEDDRTCPHCGAFPAPDPAPAPPVKDAAITAPAAAMMPVTNEPSRRSRKRGPLPKIMVAWVVLMLAIFGISQWLKEDHSRQVEVDTPTPEVPDENQKFLDQVLPECRSLLARYLLTEEIGERLPLLISDPSLPSKLQRHYQDNQILDCDPQGLRLMASTVIDLPEGTTVLTQWNSEEGAVFDAAFRLEKGAWRLDWEHFVRYSDLSWSLFLAGSDQDEAEFRLYARRRMASQDDPHPGIGVVLSSPMRRQMIEDGFSQSMQGISLSEADGKFLQAALDRAAAKTPLFGASYPDLVPEGMMRVRVRVRRSSEEGGQKYRIVKVSACHWYSSQATGLE